MPLIELNPTEEACTAFAAYHCKADKSQSNVDFTKSVLLGIMQNSVLEQRKKEALIAVDEEQTPDVEEVSQAASNAQAQLAKVEEFIAENPEPEEVASE